MIRINQLIIILLIIFLLLILYIYLIKSGKGKRGESSLWEECRRQLRLPDKIADETIERHIQQLKKRHPNRSKKWYLEKILYDLERDRR